MEIDLPERHGETLLSDARHKALFGGRGGAKSWSVATYLVLKAHTERKKIVCARQFQNSIRDSSKELVEQRIVALGLADQFTVTERAIVHRHTDSVISFIGLERNIDSIRSLEGADIVWVEEARTIKAKSMEVLLPTVRKAGSELIWTWNPEDPRDPVDAYFRGGPPRSDAIVTRVDYTDNPFFNLTGMPAEMELLRQQNYDRYRHVWLGEYDISFESKVFPNVEIGRIEVPPNISPRYGLDFGFNDPSFVVKVYVLGRTIYIAAEAVGVVPLDQLPLLLDAVLHDRGDLVRADSSQPGMIEFLNARGFGVRPARKGKGSVREGIALLQSYEIVIDPSCEQMREESRLYSWPTDKLTGKVIAGTNPVDAYNHGWDACRYACEDLLFSGEVDDTSGGVVWLFGGGPVKPDGPNLSAERVTQRNRMYPPGQLPEGWKPRSDDDDDSGGVVVFGSKRRRGWAW